MVPVWYSLILSPQSGFYFTKKAPIGDWKEEIKMALGNFKMNFDVFKDSYSSYFVVRNGEQIGSVLANRNYPKRLFVTIMDKNENALEVLKGDKLVDDTGQISIITNVEKQSNSRQFSFETPDDSEHRKLSAANIILAKNHSNVNTGSNNTITVNSVQNASLDDLSKLIINVKKEDQSALLDLVNELKNISESTKPLDKSKLTKFKSLLSRYGDVAAVTARLVFKYLFLN